MSVSVCVFVCPRSYLRKYTSDRHQISCACYLWLWLGPPVLWRRSDTLCTSGFIDDVVFAQKPRLLDVGAQLKRSAHAALGLTINCAQQYQLQANYFSGAQSSFPGGSTGGGVCSL